MVRRFTRIQTSEGGAMREECTGAFVLHGDYVKLKSRHDELLEALQDCVEWLEIDAYAGTAEHAAIENARAVIAKALGETK